MMLPTHTVVGAALATPLIYLSPGLGSVALSGALVGSVLPDLDLYAGHRRTAHYPTGYVLLAMLAAVLAGLVPTTGTVAVAFLFGGAALHCQMDCFGGGLELRPWEEGSERAVYDHVRGRWRTPKRVIPYDGSPADMVLATLLGIPLLIVLHGPFRLIVLTALLVGGCYTLLRRQLAALAPVVVGQLPEQLQGYLPARYNQ